METRPVQRRYDLDWLRVMAFSGVFLYHCSRFFNSGDWEIKNVTTSAIVDIFTGVFEMWGMPFLFAISGASIFFALRPGGAGRFLRERSLRLLVPLILGILVLAPPQVYLKRLTHGEFSGSFLEFFPHFFQPDNFSWNGVHLWFLVYLFAFTLILMPLFIWLKRPFGQQVLQHISRFSQRNGAIFLWVIPTSMLLIAVDPFGLMKPSLPEAISRLVLYILFPIYGYLIIANEGVQQAIIRQRRISMILALVLSVLSLLISSGIKDLGWKLNFPAYALIMTLAGLLIWSYILAAFGYGMHYLKVNRPILPYANEAVLPFYILHQPVILILGYFIIQLPLPILAKYLIITPLAFGITLGLYTYVIRRVNLLRRAFGLKPQKHETTGVNIAAQPLS